jgi:hypothetical protein
VIEARRARSSLSSRQLYLHCMSCVCMQRTDRRIQRTSRPPRLRPPSALPALRNCITACCGSFTAVHGQLRLPRAAGYAHPGTPSAIGFQATVISRAGVSVPCRGDCRATPNCIGLAGSGNRSLGARTWRGSSTAMGRIVAGAAALPA